MFGVKKDAQKSCNMLVALDTKLLKKKKKKKREIEKKKRRRLIDK